MKKMEQKMFGNKAHRFGVEAVGNSFDALFEPGNTVDSRNREQKENIMGYSSSPIFTLKQHFYGTEPTLKKESGIPPNLTPGPDETITRKEASVS